MLFRRLNFQNWRVGTKLLVLTVPLLAAVTLVAAWAVHQRNTASIQEKLTQRAQSLHTQIMADREYYASVVVPRIVDLGGGMRPDYHNLRGQFPLPATFVREVSELTAARREGYSVNLISPWPINKDKGLKDQFQRDAFVALQANPTAQFFRTDTIEGKTAMRVLMADYGSARSCVDCHNAHPLSPKRDFKLNDLMGGLEVVLPMDQYIQEGRQELLLTVGGGAGVCLLLVGIVVLGTRQVVTQPLASLARKMQAFTETPGDPSSPEVPKPLGDEVAYLAAAHGRMQEVILRQRTELQQVNARLEEQVVELKATNDELDSFSYSVSHDLRAPLRAMDGFSRILLDEHATAMSDEVQHYLQKVRANAQQMDLLVNELLAFSRLGRQPLTVQAVEPDILVRQALEALRSEQEGRRVKITIGDLAVCKADPALLKQVFVNLLSNALKFTRGCEVAMIAVGCHPDSSTRTYFVKDNGVGFEMQYADKLFGVFQRFHRAEDYEGTGVGLAIVQRIILRHGGHVWAEAEVDRGTTVYFTLSKGVSP
ncbi:ATP-binding protein [Nitrospiraceae bacterium AH_259_D15_M11_P09]|nr:ATP-binding protein [Nitrospiraceae bacterium AH_259_D15_M11_P09]